MLQILEMQPLWRVSPAETHVDATRGDFTVRFAADRSPLVVTPALPDGYPYVLAAFVWNCVRHGTRGWWVGTILERADLWHRLAMSDYLKHWADLLDWMPLAPAELLALALETAERLRPQVHTDDDARRATATLQTTVASAPTYSRITGFLTHLEYPQRTIAQGMYEAGAEIDVFWGPEQMDVWRLNLRRGDATVGFSIERGFSDGVTVDHRRMRDRGARAGWTSYGYLWLVWALRTGVIPQSVDPLGSHASADYTAWPAVLDWLDAATDADLTAIDRLVLAVQDLHRKKYGERRREVPVEQRIEAAERAILGT